MATMVKRIRDIGYDDELDALVMTLEIEGERLQLGFTLPQAEQLLDELYAVLERGEDFEEDFDEADDPDLDW